ncbi:MAG TPA: universal stress protein [Methylomirabilota bacterium]|jgi:nucleotide-binding universal stress UspA family protein|nr:universal stress protein [Methylomirabilota bacterium]
METPSPVNPAARTIPGPFKRILVAVDGSDRSLDAVRFAARLASALSAELNIMTVYHAPSDALGEPNYSRALEEALAEAQRILEEARRVALNAGGPEPKVEWLAGQPAETIVETARAGDYDLVVVGTLGRGRLGAALLGSVSSAVAAHAGRPVLVVGDVLR